ncbi:hypothetical protein D0T87_02285 [Bacteroides sp. 51]|nr:hypothetical protein [Bacteroides sp. 51]
MISLLLLICSVLLLKRMIEKFVFDFIVFLQITLYLFPTVISNFKMKSSKEITSYLSKFVTAKEDRRKIMLFLKEKGLGDSFPRKKKKTITFEEFESWFYGYTPQKGDCIESGGVWGIIQDIQSDVVYLGISVVNGSLNQTIKKLAVSEIYQACAQKILLMQNLMFQKKLSWSRFHNKVVPSKKISRNDFVRITRLGQKLGLGIFKENLKGDIILFVYLQTKTGREMDYSLSINIGKEEDYQIEMISPEERYDLIEELAACHKVWNGHFERVEPINWKADSGDYYYYINETSEIIRDVESDRQKDLKRLRGYNYYRKMDNARVVLDLMKKIWLDMYGSSSDIKMIGKTYFYINENLNVVSKPDNGKPKDLSRYCGRNYFRTEADALKATYEMIELRKKQLVETKIPSIKKRR